MNDDGAAELYGNIVSLRVGSDAVAMVEDCRPVRREDVAQRAFLRRRHALSRTRKSDAHNRSEFNRLIKPDRAPSIAVNAAASRVATAP